MRCTPSSHLTSGSYGIDNASWTKLMSLRTGAGDPRAAAVRGRILLHAGWQFFRQQFWQAGDVRLAADRFAESGAGLGQPASGSWKALGFWLAFVRSRPCSSVG